MDAAINLETPAIKVEAVLKDDDHLSTLPGGPGVRSDVPPSDENHPLKAEDRPVAAAPSTAAVEMSTPTAAEAASSSQTDSDGNAEEEEEEEDGPRPFPCDQCAISFVDRLQLAVHERMHGTESAMPCRECGIVFHLPLALARHERLHLPRPPRQPRDERRRSQRSKVTGIARLLVTCGGCEQEFEEVQMRDHHIGYFWCARCKRVFGLRCQWRKHGCPGRPGRPPAQQPPPTSPADPPPSARKRRGRPRGSKSKKRAKITASSFDSDNGFVWEDEELAGVPAGPDGAPPEGMRCEMCDLTFISERGARRHYDAKHSNQSFDCEVCERKFNRLDSLVTHSMEAHRQARQYPCTHCSRLFTQRRIIEYHMARAHSKPARRSLNGDGMDDLLDGDDVVAGTSGEWEGYRCADCGRTFRNRVRLAEHRHSVHEQPGHRFRCELCESSYTRVDELTKHTITVHNQEKTHHCEKCNKASFTHQNTCVI